MPAKISLLKLTQGKTIKAMYEKYQCIQDLLVPLSTLSDSLEYFHKEFQVQLLLLWFVVLLLCAWQLIKAATVLSSLRTCHIVFLHLLHMSFEISTFNFHYTHTFNGHFSGTTRVSRYQNGKTYLDFTEARDIEWQWHPLGHMQVCTSLQADNHATSPPLSFLQAGCPSCHPTNSVKAPMAFFNFHKRTIILPALSVP